MIISTSSIIFLSETVISHICLIDKLSNTSFLIWEPFFISAVPATAFLETKSGKSLSIIFCSVILNSSSLSSANLEISSLSISIARSSFSMPLREKTLTSTTVPETPGRSLKEVSRTSAAFSPNIALSNFSSGVAGVSPFGVTLPTKISLGPTSAPIYTIPASSRFFNASSPTFGISLLISSGPSLVSLAIISNSSI